MNKIFCKIPPKLLKWESVACGEAFKLLVLFDFLIRFKQNRRGQYMNKNNCLNSWKFRLNQGYTCKLAELELNSKSHLTKGTNF